MNNFNCESIDERRDERFDWRYSPILRLEPRQDETYNEITHFGDLMDEAVRSIACSSLLLMRDLQTVKSLVIENLLDKAEFRSHQVTLI